MPEVARESSPGNATANDCFLRSQTRFHKELLELMFDIYLWGVLIVCILGFLMVYRATMDCFHPLVILLPMLVTNYWYTPWTLVKNGSLDAYLDTQQREFVQTIYFYGVVALI